MKIKLQSKKSQVLENQLSQLAFLTTDGGACLPLFAADVVLTAFLDHRLPNPAKLPELQLKFAKSQEIAR